MYPRIIPQHLQEELIQIGEDITRHTFRIGDIVVAVSEFVEINEIDCTKRDVWRAVGSFIGKAAGTVQGYESLSNFFPHSVRRQYDILSASHFRMAMRIDSKGEYDWKVVLDYAVDRVEDYGRPATVDELMKVFIYNSEPFDFEDELIKAVERSPFDDFRNRLNDLDKTIELLPVPEHVRAELKDTLRRMESVLMVEV